jgi:DNA gyrase subunit A
VKKTLLEAYSRPRANGVNAITVRDGDELLEAILTNGRCDILLAARGGKCVRFHEDKVRAIGRTGAGVRGITIESGNEVISMICVDTHSPDNDKVNIMVVSENGYGKRSDLEDYRTTNRGGKGVRTINVTEKTGALIAMKEVTDENDLMIINKSGLTIRLAVADIRVTGRVTQGVKLINLKGKDSIAAVCKVNRSEDDDQQIQKEEPEA